jgi:hypothetical protein
MKNEKSAGAVLALMAQRQDLPASVKALHDYGLVEAGDVFLKVDGDPLGSYGNKQGTVYLMPWLVREGLRIGLLQAVTMTQEVACA